MYYALHYWFFFQRDGSCLARRVQPPFQQFFSSSRMVSDDHKSSSSTKMEVSSRQRQSSILLPGEIKFAVCSSGTAESKSCERHSKSTFSLGYSIRYELFSQQAFLRKIELY